MGSGYKFVAVFSKSEELSLGFDVIFCVCIDGKLLDFSGGICFVLPYGSTVKSESLFSLPLAVEKALIEFVRMVSSHLIIFEIKYL